MWPSLRMVKFRPYGTSPPKIHASHPRLWPEEKLSSEAHRITPAHTRTGSQSFTRRTAAYNTPPPMEPRPIRLTVLQPNLAPMNVKPAGPLITLGRATDCTVPIRDRYLSRRHAEIIFDERSWILRDCGSVNGTLLNGTRLAGSAPLKPGDRITLGDSEVVFEP